VINWAGARHPGPFSCPYSPKCLEDAFSEVRPEFIGNSSHLPNVWRVEWAEVTGRILQIDTEVLVAIIGLIGIVVTALVAPIVVPAVRNWLARSTRRDDYAEPGPPDPPTGTEGDIIYTVKDRDTLGKIARRYNIPLDVLEKANPQITDRDSIFPGDKVLIPWQSRRDT
jgi:hypothetical protein